MSRLSSCSAWLPFQDVRADTRTRKSIRYPRADCRESRAKSDIVAQIGLRSNHHAPGARQLAGSGCHHASTGSRKPRDQNPIRLDCQARIARISLPDKVMYSP
jgi:hypothetical protein